MESFTYLIKQFTLLTFFRGLIFSAPELLLVIFQPYHFFTFGTLVSALRPSGRKGRKNKEKRKKEKRKEKSKEIK